MPHLRLLASTHGTFSARGKETEEKNYASKNTEKKSTKKETEKDILPHPPQILFKKKNHKRDHERKQLQIWIF